MAELSLTNEEFDFVQEMMSIGSGNAAAAFSQLLNCEVDITIPRIEFAPAMDAIADLRDPATPVIGIKMDMVGDIKGNLFFIITQEDKNTLIKIVKEASPGVILNENIEISALMEVANILAGVYLTAIHDFVKLNIYHSPSLVAEDMFESILDEAIANLSANGNNMLLVENEFIIKKGKVNAFLLIIPSVDSVKTLVGSIKNAFT